MDGRVYRPSLLLVALGCLVFFPPHARAGSPMPVVTVTAAEYPPFVFRTDPGDPSGFETELLKRFASGEKIEVRYRFLPAFGDVLPALARGEGDMAGGALHATPDRKKRFLFSTYLRTGLVLVGKRGAPPLDGEAGVAGRPVGVKQGATGHLLAKGWQARYPGVTVVPFSTTKESYDALAAGTIDLLVDDYLHAKHLILNGDACAILTRPLTEVGVGFAYRNDPRGKALKTRMDRFLERFLGTKEFRDLYEAYFF
ncbi:MAG: transporter substrate-binding domain-containing protein [Deltaproteobacteria bacterium]